MDAVLAVLAVSAAHTWKAFFVHLEPCFECFHGFVVWFLLLNVWGGAVVWSAVVAGSCAVILGLVVTWGCAVAFGVVLDEVLILVVVWTDFFSIPFRIFLRLSLFIIFIIIIDEIADVMGGLLNALVVAGVAAVLAVSGRGVDSVIEV